MELTSSRNPGVAVCSVPAVGDEKNGVSNGRQTDLIHDFLNKVHLDVY